jgi:hypothetical protein
MRTIKEGTGPFTTAQGVAWGFTPSEMRWAIRTGRWIRLRHGVYVTVADRQRAAAHPMTLHAQDVRALQLALTHRRIVAGDTSATRILGIDLRNEPGPDIVALTDEDVSCTHRDGYFLRVALLPDQQVWKRHDVLVTTPARTVLDIAANHGFDDGVVAAESAYRQRLLTPKAFGQLIDASSQRPGIRTARDVLAFADPLTESVLESVSRLSMRQLPIRMPLTQVVIVDDFPRVRVDFFWPWFRLVGEGDGMAKYEMNGRKPMTALREEREREQRIRDADCDIVRWDWWIANDPRRLAARLLPAMQRAEARLRGRAS